MGPLFREDRWLLYDNLPVKVIKVDKENGTITLNMFDSYQREVPATELINFNTVPENPRKAREVSQILSEIKYRRVYTKGYPAPKSVAVGMNRRLDGIRMAGRILKPEILSLFKVWAELGCYCTESKLLRALERFDMIDDILMCDEDFGEIRGNLLNLVATRKCYQHKLPNIPVNPYMRGKEGVVFVLEGQESYVLRHIKEKSEVIILNEKEANSIFIKSLTCNPCAS